MRFLILAAGGFLLDTLFGDPEWLWHPVCAVGTLISWLEKHLRRIFPSGPRAEVVAGVLLWLCVTGTSFGVTAVFLTVLERVSPWLRLAAESVLCGLILARRSLCRAGAHVEQALCRSLAAGREAVGWYVGRDTSALSQEEVLKAAVETIAENTTDGVVAPLFFLLLGGAPLGMWYKAVNTLDSMVGYHNEKYEFFGKFSAKMDDLVNLLPARISALLLIAAAGLSGLDGRGALRIWIRDRSLHKSPNAGQTESAVAGALGVQLGGDAVYFGKTVKKAPMGDADRSVEAADIGRTVRMMRLASILALGLGMLTRLLAAGCVQELLRIFPSAVG